MFLAHWMLAFFEELQEPAMRRDDMHHLPTKSNLRELLLPCYYFFFWLFED